jgi:hypothetical protein
MCHALCRAAKPAPRYGGLVPPFYLLLNLAKIIVRYINKEVSIHFKFGTMNKKILLAVASFIFCNMLHAQETKIYAELIGEAEELYEQEEFLKSGYKYSEAFLIPEQDEFSFSNRYDAARSWTLANEIDSAFTQLFIFQEGLFSPYFLKLVDIKSLFALQDNILSDTIMNSLHFDPRWEEFIEIIEANLANIETKIDMQLVLLLDTVFENDQRYRDQISTIEKEYGFDSPEMDAILKKMKKQDSLDLIIIEKILNERGWLGPDIIGSLGSSTLVAVILHSPPEILEKYLPMMREAVKKGDARADQLAYVEDRHNKHQNRKQVYGSQLDSDPETGEWSVWPIEDPGNVDKRRAEIGLNTIQEYISEWGMTWDLEAHRKRVAEFEAQKK